MFDRMKTILRFHVEENAQKMYKDASAKIMSGLDEMTTAMSGRLITASNTASDKLHKDVKQLISTAVFGQKDSTIVLARSELRKNILRELDKLEDAWVFEAENPLTPVKKDRVLEPVEDGEGGMDGMDDDFGNSGEEDDLGGLSNSNVYDFRESGRHGEGFEEDSLFV